ncbi:MAG: AAA-like domain-containing protein [Desulfobacterales bacterium]|nr:AAA-like domain-containing protein [Desulfobacterales bacterium]
MKFFNTAGPVNNEKHYCVEPLERINLEAIFSLIESEKYFILHAPRQTGKTSCLLALMDYLNKEGKYKSLYFNVEAAQGAREDVYRGIKSILSEMSSRARSHLHDDFPDSICFDILAKRGEDNALNQVLTLWSEKSEKPLILLIDEIDSLVGDTLISVLRQIRAGYDKRPKEFPQSIILCGVRDINDYRIHSSREKAIITGGSAFNIKAESLRIGDFSKEDTEKLYHCHTQETGQKFTKEAIDIAWDLTCGQPWLVNALAYEVCFKIKEGRDRTKNITKDMILKAKEDLIMRRETHLDQLADKLKEERVKQVIAPMLLGQTMDQIVDDDIQYLIDLGLIRKTSSGLRISNPIYNEIIPRQLTIIAQYNLEPQYSPEWYIKADNKLDMKKLITAFQEFFRENSEHWIERFQYKEAGPQLLMQAFLQRIVNGGGIVNREYGLGMMRTDLFIAWQYGENKEDRQKIVIELKMLHKSLNKTLEQGLMQTAEYMDKCGADEGYLIIFDKTKGKSWRKKIFKKEETFENKKITIFGM